MSIFSGERTVRFGAVKFDIFKIFEYLKYTTRARCRQCDRLHNANYKTKNPIRLYFSSKQFYPNRLFRDLLVARIGMPPIDQINTVS